MAARSRKKKVGTRRSTINKRRKGALSVLVPWMKRFGVLTLVAVLGIWLGAWLWMSGGFQKAGNGISGKLTTITADMGFTVQNVKVEGRVYSNAAALKAIVDTQKGAPLFALNPADLREKIEAMDWIKKATVERRLPGTLYIRVQEHTPLALWQEKGTLRLLDEEGGLINTNKLARFRNLVIVMGKDAPAKAPELLADLAAETAIAPRITTAKWMDNRRWDLVTRDNVTIRLPESDAALALRLLAKAQEEDKILEKDITMVDLREQGRIVLRTRPGSLQEYKAMQAKQASGDNI